MNGTFNIFDWDGPTFLTAYIVAVVAVFLLRLLTRGLSHVDAGTVSGQGLEAYDSAFLVEGPRRVIGTVVARLVARGQVRLVSNERVERLAASPGGPLRTQGSEGVPLDPWEQAVLDVLDGEGSMSIDQLVTRLQPQLDELRRRVADAGWLDRSVPTWVYSGLLAIVWVLGIIKVVVGLMRGRAVDILVVFCVLLPVAIALGHRRRGRLTFAGHVLLKQKQTKFEALRTTASSSSAMLTIEDIGWAFSLFGATIFAGSAALAGLSMLHGFGAVSADGLLGYIPHSDGVGSGLVGGGGCGSGCGGGCGSGCGGGCGGCGS